MERHIKVFEYLDYYDLEEDYDTYPRKNHWWYCNVCNGQNSVLDSECEFCECEGKDCKRDNCDGENCRGSCDVSV